MQRGHCERGIQLYDLYQEKSLDLVVVDAENALGRRAASQAEWLAMMQRKHDARAAYGRARCDYIEHVVNCRACEWDRLADAYLEAMEQPGREMQAEMACAGGGE